MKRVIISLVCIACFDTCITPLEVVTEESRGVLVVEGFITTELGPHRFRLTRTARYGSVFDAINPNEKRARIWIRDGIGNVTFLTHVTGAIYETSSEFSAEVGKSYTLHIVTQDGAEYASLPERVVPVPPIDSLLYEFRKLPSKSPYSFRSGLEVFAIWQDPEESTDFYMWKNSGTYLIESHPELFKEGRDRVPAPKDCCAICWTDEIAGDNGIRIFKDNHADGVISTSIVAFIEDNGQRFMDKYYVIIDQLSISREAYQFFKLLQGQMSIDGDIFDPPPATVRGNIINITDPDDYAIGYFQASDIKSKSIFLPREALAMKQKRFYMEDDCRVLPGTTTSKPPFWVD